MWIHVTNISNELRLPWLVVTTRTKTVLRTQLKGFGEWDGLILWENANGESTTFLSLFLNRSINCNNCYIREINMFNWLPLVPDRSVSQQMPHCLQRTRYIVTQMTIAILPERKRKWACNLKYDPRSTSLQSKPFNLLGERASESFLILLFSSTCFTANIWKTKATDLGGATVSSLSVFKTNFNEKWYISLRIRVRATWTTYPLYTTTRNEAQRRNY